MGYRKGQVTFIFARLHYLSVNFLNSSYSIGLTLGDSRTFSRMVFNPKSTLLKMANTSYKVTFLPGQVTRTF